MLPKKKKLPIQGLVSKKPSHTLQGKLFLLQFFPSPLSFLRWGVVISKGVFKKATDRNALKRIIFAAAEGVEGTGDILLVVRKKAATASKDELTAEVRALLKNAIK